MKFLSSRERLIYGINPVMEALRARRTFRMLQVQRGREGDLSEILKMARSLSVRIETVEKDYLDNRMPKGHQGVAARIIDKRDSSLESLLDEINKGGEQPFFIVLDGIEDPRNYGALLRTADAAGVHAVFRQTHGSAGYSETASKSSSGAIEHVTVIETSNIKHVLDKMIDADINLIAADHNADKTLWEADLRGAIALVIGGEGRGLRETVRKMCHESISIPMAGSISSLNVSVAAGVLCFEAVRQRSLRAQPVFNKPVNT